MFPLVSLCSVGYSPLAEQINSADPNAKSEPHAATWETGRCRAGKMKEKSGPLILLKKKNRHVCADFSTR